MNTYTVYAQRLAWAGKRKDYATLQEFDIFDLKLDQQGYVKAPTAEAALKEAKRLKYFAPIISPLNLGALQ